MAHQLLCDTLLSDDTISLSIMLLPCDRKTDMTQGTDNVQAENTGPTATLDVIAKLVGPSIRRRLNKSWSLPQHAVAWLPFTLVDCSGRKTRCRVEGIRCSLTGPCTWLSVSFQFSRDSDARWCLHNMFTLPKGTRRRRRHFQTRPPSME